jgi:hypothetical protein
LTAETFQAPRFGGAWNLAGGEGLKSSNVRGR